MTSVGARMWAVVEVQKVEDVTLTIQEFPSYSLMSRVEVLKILRFLSTNQFCGKDSTIELLNFSCNVFSGEIFNIE